MSYNDSNLMVYSLLEEAVNKADHNQGGQRRRMLRGQLPGCR